VLRSASGDVFGALQDKVKGSQERANETVDYLFTTPTKSKMMEKTAKGKQRGKV